MQLFNFRLGLATNSSSAHSLIFMKGLKERYDGGGEFGWDNFVLTSPEAKSKYVAVLLRYALLRNGLSESATSTLVNAWSGVDADDSDYIDHQSVIDLPCEYNTRIIDKQFFDDFKRFMLRDDLAILGGNDNSDLSWKPEGDFTLPLPDMPFGEASLICRKDHNYWTIFDQRDGTKLRFSFNDLSVAPTKANAPELVDISITDHCPFDCAFCYRGSTPDGKHADQTYIDAVLRGLGKLKVFEIAIGGGEPTLHPDFIRILKRAREYGIVPNFTTRNLAWLRDAEQRIPILEYAGAFAVSVDNADQIIKLGEALKDKVHDLLRVNIHIVMGTVKRESFELMIKTAHDLNIRVTLLGYKTNNRGGEYPPHDYSWWLESVKSLIGKNECPYLSIDTVLAAQYDAALQQAGIPKWTYHIKDGGFSAYVDAVAMKMGPSSYGDESEMIDLPSQYFMDEAIQQVFSQF